MSLTKVSYAMIEGDPISVLDYGAVGDGVTDDTTAIQNALAASNNVVVPSGTYVVKGTITLAANKALSLNSSTLLKPSSSTNTDPIVNITGSNAILQGNGNASLVSQVNTPNGIVGLFDAAHVNNIFSARVSGLTLQGDDDATSNIIYAESGSQQGGTGYTYFTFLDSLVLTNGANGIYFTAEVNAALISNIIIKYMNVAAFNFVGTASANANVYANTINNIWYTNSTDTTFAKLRYATNNAFTNCMAEQGGGVSALYADLDATAQANTFKGVSNVAGGSVTTDDGDNFFEMNGSTISDVGTWTPTIVGGTTAGANTYFYQYGQYIRMGRLVYVQFFVQINAKDGAMAGDVLVGNLPVTSKAMSGGTNGSPTIAVSGYTNLTLPANYTQVNVQVAPGGTLAYVRRMGSAQAAANVQTSEIANSFTIAGSGIYLASSPY